MYTEVNDAGKVGRPAVADAEPANTMCTPNCISQGKQTTTPWGGSSPTPSKEEEVRSEIFMGSRVLPG